MVDGRLAILAFAVGLGVRDVSSHPGGLWLISLGCTGGPKWLSHWNESEPLENYEDRSTYLSMNDIIPRSILLLFPTIIRWQSISWVLKSQLSMLSFTVIRWSQGSIAPSIVVAPQAAERGSSCLYRRRRQRSLALGQSLGLW